MRVGGAASKALVGAILPNASKRAFTTAGPTSKLDEKTMRMCQIAGYTASGNLSRLSKIWQQLPKTEHAAGTEVILQNTVYNGIPRTLMALTTVLEIGIKDRIIIHKTSASTLDQRFAYAEQGLTVAKEVYGYKHQRFLHQMRLLHPAYGRWVVEFMMGRLRSRPGLSQKERCLIELAAIGGHFVLPQFISGVMSALTCGATMEEIRAVLDMTGEVWGAERQAMVDGLWRDLRTNKLHGGWRMDEKDPDYATTVKTHSQAKPKDTLKADWSHLRHPSQILIPPWRHPLVKSFRYVGALPDRLRLYALAAAHTASGNLSTLKRDWTYIPADHHRAGLEAIMQTVAFSGFHRLHNALRTVHEAGVCATGIDIEGEDNVDSSKFEGAGMKTLGAIYTSSLGPLEKSISKMHPDMWCFIKEFAYGQVLARPGLTVGERELSALGVLVGNATFPQLRSHMRGALLNGATVDQVRGVLDQTEAVWGRPAQTYVDGFWLEFAKDRKGVQKPSEREVSASSKPPIM